MYAVRVIGISGSEIETGNRVTGGQKVSWCSLVTRAMAVISVGQNIYTHEFDMVDNVAIPITHSVAKDGNGLRHDDGRSIGALCQE